MERARPQVVTGLVSQMFGISYRWKYYHVFRKEIITTLKVEALYSALFLLVGR